MSTDPNPINDQSDDGSIPEAGDKPEPRFDVPTPPAPPVADPPSRNTEF